MEISVIIPCYNSEETLGEQLEALAGQEFSPPWEVIVADNGSTDRSVDVARSFRGRLPDLVIVDASDRRGAAYARNRGAAVARSGFLAFCDADDVVGEGYLEAVARALEQFGFVACRYEYARLNHRWISRLPGVQLTDVDCGMLGPIKYAGGGSLAVRKAVHELVGGFDETSFPVLQDTDYCARIQREGVWLHFVPEAVVHYRWRDTVLGAFKQARNWGRDVVALRLRYWPVELPVETPRSFLRRFRELARIRNPQQLASLIWATGWRLGTIDGWREHTRSNPSKAREEAGNSRSLGARVADAAGLLLSGFARFSGRASGGATRSGFARLDETSHLEHPILFGGREHIRIGARVRIASCGWVRALSRCSDRDSDPEIHIGSDTAIGRCCQIVAKRKVSIGRNVTIGDRVYISDHLSRSCGEVSIGDGCTIGDGAWIVGNVRMGERSLLEPNAVLTEDLPPHSVAAGVPARVVSRFNPATQRWEPGKAEKCFPKKTAFTAGPAAPELNRPAY